MTEDAFLLTIRERPDDDGPRLVYADWLDEQGDPRGEFIRLQIELATSPSLPPDRAEQFRQRETELLDAHGREWTWPIAAVFEGCDRGLYGSYWGCYGSMRQRCWEYVRGFVSAFRFPTVDLLRHAADLFAVTPVQAVELSGFYINPSQWHDKASHEWYWPAATWEWLGKVTASRYAVPPEPCFRFAAVLTRQTERKLYPTPAAALADVGQAARAFGREQAGLPPL